MIYHIIIKFTYYPLFLIYLNLILLVLRMNCLWIGCEWKVELKMQLNRMPNRFPPSSFRSFTLSHDNENEIENLIFVPLLMAIVFPRTKGKQRLGCERITIIQFVMNKFVTMKKISFSLMSRKIISKRKCQKDRGYCRFNWIHILQSYNLLWIRNKLLIFTTCVWK